MVHSMDWSQAWNNMFPLQLPWVEKLLRPVIVYLALVVLLRVFGKRELAQLNPFDLVVLLSLSNTVQNAIIGNDNTVTGGLMGACALLSVNWIVARILFRSRRLTHALEGRSTILVRHGRLNHAALRRESLTVEDLMSVLHRQGFASLDQVALCQLEPNGTFYIEANLPTTVDRNHVELLQKLDALQEEVRQLKTASVPKAGSTGS